jgi:hypothetical protein
LAVAMNHTATNAGAGYVTVPALNLNTNTVTITAWVYPFGDITIYEGVVFTRASAYPAGLNYVALPSRPNMIGYTWNHGNINTYGWASGLITPSGQWSFLALTIAPTQAVIYVGTNGVLLSATNAIAHDVEAWNGGTLLGADTAVLPDRIFQGKLDEVAVFDYALSPAQIAQLYSTAFTGGSVTLSVQRSGASLLLGWTHGALLAAPGVNGPWTPVSGAAPPAYWVAPSAAQMFYRVLVH